MQKAKSSFQCMNPKTLESTLAKWKAVPSLLFEKLSCNGDEVIHAVEITRCFVRELWFDFKDKEVISVS